DSLLAPVDADDVRAPGLTVLAGEVVRGAVRVPVTDLVTAAVREGRAARVLDVVRELPRGPLLLGPVTPLLGDDSRALTELVLAVALGLPGSALLEAGVDLTPGWTATDLDRAHEQPMSLAHWTRRHVLVRAASEALRTGSFEPIETDDPRIGAFTRSSPSEK